MPLFLNSFNIMETSKSSSSVNIENKISCFLKFFLLIFRKLSRILFRILTPALENEFLNCLYGNSSHKNYETLVLYMFTSRTGINKLELFAAVSYYYIHHALA